MLPGCTISAAGPLNIAFLVVSDTCTKLDHLDASGQVARCLIRTSGHRLISEAIVPDSPNHIKRRILDWCTKPLPLASLTHPLISSPSIPLIEGALASSPCSEGTFQPTERCFVDVVITSGGTGLSSRDQTPGAVLSLLSWSSPWDQAARLNYSREEDNGVEITRSHRLPGIETALTIVSLQHTPLAALARFTAIAFYDSGSQCYRPIICLPGSPKAVHQCLNFLIPILPHMVNQLRDRPDSLHPSHGEFSGQVLIESPKKLPPQRPPPLPPQPLRQVPLFSAAEQATVSNPSATPRPPCYPTCSYPTVSEFSPIKSITQRPRTSPFPMLSVQSAIDLVLSEAFDLAFHRLHTRDQSQRIEWKNFEAALGRRLAVSLTGLECLPPYDASMKDGYACILVEGAGPRQVIGVLRAGDEAGFGEPDLTLGTCYRVSTGGRIPKGADCVVQVEDTELIETKLVSRMKKRETMRLILDDVSKENSDIGTRHNKSSEPDNDKVPDGVEDEEEEAVIMVKKAPSCVGHNIRPRGSDLPLGMVFPRGMRLGPTELGLLASAGLFSDGQHPDISVKADHPDLSSCRLPCFPAIRVGILSSGDELIDPCDFYPHTSSSLNVFIRDSNRPCLLSLLRASTAGDRDCPVELIDLGLVGDKIDQLAEKLHFSVAEAACDVVVTTGGMSMGENDLLLRVLTSRLNARIHFARLLMKPGKPTAFATVTW
ncbi:unnamed protein product [Protopolystoma xenopodis]|uniref:MoaB/Mog domain-containing protein n=1 Tax=Protopolystoma xenopodis TaxID=117903 RepID=A0A3S5B016_9PLAT|nr:unnamed protein product [Protopolystoma xenopodis]